MHKDIGEDIYRGNLGYTMISLFSSRINVLIIGAGKAALIKAKTFLSNGCNVSVVAKEINEAFYKLDSEKITITKCEYMMQLSKNSKDIEILKNVDTKEIVKLEELIPDWWGKTRV